ncbi:hypothetical protein ACIPWI_35185 [Streptomyces sp. NPDC090046]|uniref:hypothetical protein n=1 Tax=Streptomyces sp. NPDC090046 TaxID=3365928 RepID=UPI0037F419EB
MDAKTLPDHTTRILDSFTDPFLLAHGHAARIHQHRSTQHHPADRSFPPDEGR